MAKLRLHELETGDPHASEIARCAADFAYFVDTYVWIDDPQGHGDGSGKVRFRLWPAQREVVPSLLSESLLIFLKARQLGISWLVIAYVVWLCKFHPGKTGLFLSQGKEEANEMIRRAIVVVTGLPDWLQAHSPLRSDPNVSNIVWSSGSRIKSLAATPKAGSSFTASVVVMDEAAKMQFAGKLYTAVKPTVDAGGQLIVISSAWGASGLFYNLWKKAEQGLNRFKAIFLPWTAHPDRPADFVEKAKAEAVDPDEVSQEYPATSTEAFLASGNVRFPTSWIAKQESNIREGLTQSELPQVIQNLPGLTVYVAPSPGKLRRVMVSCDIAEGKLDDSGKPLGDADHAVFVDIDSMEELANLHGHWEPDEFAEKVYWVASQYRAWILPERNNHGHAFILKIRELIAKNDRTLKSGMLGQYGQFNNPVSIADGHDGYHGWVTSPKTKPLAVDRLAAGLRDSRVIVHSRATLTEMSIFQKKGNGRTGAPDGSHDDRVMAWVILLGWLNMGEDIPEAVAVGNPMSGVRYGT